MYTGNPADFAIAASLDADFAQTIRSLYVGGTGNVSVVMPSGNTVIFQAVPVGILPVRCKRINSVGTSATNIILLW